ncbi:TetR/AcrR family transcriptional regulator [Jiangella aurantiaca]|uniref:TetR/AcrR family transcriptional regulator n=1 Tax=Jiangella aurantiaca TaxID=2530373 RepID=A0A4R5AQR3_9ACTN|nr:TetR/AcrR family transcriptional regulator [Jiangella aurantiaca]TDD72702.1 TetR/AcrR family transcriptional regulator [Jiangella aurantiaca]
MTPRRSPQAGTERSLLAKAGYHHGNLRSALIESAVALVRARGAHRFTLAEAARVAGVTAAAPYRHFESREELLACVAESGFEQLKVAMNAVDLTAWDDPLDRVIALGMEYVQFAIREPQLFRLMFSVEERLPASAAGLAALDLLEQTLEQAGRAGRLTVDAGTAKRAAWALAHGVAILRIDGMATFESDTTTDIASTLRTLLTGLAGTPEA